MLPLPSGTFHKQNENFLIMTLYTWCYYLALLIYVRVKLNTRILVLFQLIMLLRAHEPKDLRLVCF